ncbi:MAG: metallophosphoesterase [Candidatus Poribacteria bacterium]|nr:metallophosphoesterase [Candidatus Poribacteria bacterium]
MQRILVFLLILAFLAVNLSCAQKGLMTEKYAREFYRVPQLRLDGLMEKNPTFIVYGDSRPDWRLLQKFARRKNWLTWKMLIFPFYQVYWLGNGIVGGINRLRYTPDYGVRERRMMRDAVYAEAKRTGVDFIFHTGDMVVNGRYPSHWETFLKENKVEKPLVMEFPYFPVTGNHEYTNDNHEYTNDSSYGYPNYQAIFEHPLFYVLDFPDAAIFVLDSNLIIDQYQFIDDDTQEELFRTWFVSGDPGQPGWLERELAARKDKAFKIIVAHHPMISFGRHHTDWQEPDFGKSLPEKRWRLLKFFQEQGIQLLIFSHEHLYEHSIVKSISDKNQPKSQIHNNPQREIHIVVSGGAGVPLRERSDAELLHACRQNYRDEGLDVILVKQEVAYHYCLIDIDTDQLTVKVLGVERDPKRPQRLIEEIVIKKKI